MSRPIRGSDDGGTAGRYRHVVLSPHLDDAVLSCGAAMHRWWREGRPVLVVNAMTADPPPDGLSAFALGLHVGWGVAGDAAYARRRSEDQAALASLGAGRLDLGFADCIYRRDARGHFYASEAALFGTVHPGDAHLAAELARTMRDLAERHAGARFYAPIGIGGHVDHQLVRDAAEKAIPVGLRLYEDFPYVARPGAFAPYQSDAAGQAAWAIGLEPAAVRLARADVRAKARAIARYASQIGILFGSRYAMARSVWRHARGGSPDPTYREPLWRRAV